VGLLPAANRAVGVAALVECAAEFEACCGAAVVDRTRLGGRDDLVG
jgi:hypothetical protein